MVDPLVRTTVAFLHIVFGIAWLGASLFFVFVLVPRFRALSPPSQMEFIAKVGKATSRYALVVGGLTIVFGLLLLDIVFGGDYRGWPLTIEIGFTLGLMAFLDVLLLLAPAINKGTDIAIELIRNGQQGSPPAEFLAVMKRGGIATAIELVLLFIAAVFMVATAFY